MRLILLLLLSCPLLGQPAGYFQQYVSYDIDVRLDDADHTLAADLRLAYTNNAAEALDSIVFHLWPRAFSSDNTAFARQQLRNGNTAFHFADPARRGTLDSLDFRVNGEAARFRFTDDPDIGVLYLDAPLANGATATITTPFRVKIPASFSRLGHVGESYQITQWYPKPAVYDRNGWHAMPYLDQGEFYSEFGDFRVRITVPENYVVAATGELQTATEREWLLERAAKTRQQLDAADPLQLAFGYVDQLFPASATGSKTLTYTAERVHDFAWFADKRFMVLHDTLHLRPRQDPPIDTWSFFTDTEAALWKNSIDYLKRATRFYSEHIGPYPYPQVTGVQSALSAGAGMEYPMITVIGRSYTDYGLDEVLAHEIGHNWFYGVLGSNERDHAWMDEGLNSYYEGRYTREFYPDRNGRSQFIPGREVDPDALGYRYMARLGRDQAPDTPADSLGSINYWIAAYSKPELVLTALEERIGIDRLDAAFREYYRDWQFRHPQPDDFYAALVPLEADDYLRDAMETVDEGAFNTAARQREHAAGIWLPKLALITDAEGPRSQLFVSPLLGFNENDGVLAGLAFHNRTLEPRPLEFLLAPLYGFGSKRLAGFAGGRLRLTRPLPGLQRVTVGGGVRRFSDFDPPALDGVYGYDRWAARTTFVLDHPAPSGRYSELYSQFIRLEQRRPDFDAGGGLRENARRISTTFLRAGYQSRLDREINPVAYGFRIEYREGDRDEFIASDYLRLDATYRAGYQYQRNKFLRWRLFGGYYLLHDNRDGLAAPGSALSLVDNADSDYAYDDLYLGRSQGGWYQQQLETRQGGFRAPIPAAFPFGRSNSYLAALNLDGDLPFPGPLGLYFDAGAYGARGTLNQEQTNQFRWVGGLTLNFFGEQFQLAVPLVADADTRLLLDQRGNLLERITFRLRLTRLLPWRWVDTLP
ncbi:M1 family metallopeptidase [Lewinella sp. IMCC34183]|uniref:M1 family metallopeptidase n=1 Tax=Lewinella sp. IMCC34183 TaxID=2248762 RepID=UPI000E271575|nr:M1 family metallopeptidase [Lewinella sp. IMCC34183]